MNKNFWAIVIVVLIILIGGGLLYFGGGASGIFSGNATTTSGGTAAVINSGGNTNTPAPQPAAPTAITNSSVSPTDTTAIVNGMVNPNGAFTSYWYEYGSTPNFGNKTGNQTLGSGFTSISAPGYIVSLNKNSTYYFRLVAENQFGRVTGSQYSFTTTEGNPPPVGSAPTSKTLAATGVSRTTANINGEVTPNKAETQYWFEYGKTTDLGNVSAFSSAGSGSSKSSVSISLSDLAPLTTYYFRLNSQNQFGTVNGSILNFKTLGPAGAKAPGATTGSATDITSNQAVLHGTATPNFLGTNYWFEYGTDSSLSSASIQTSDQVDVGSGGTVVPLDKSIANLDSATTYYFRIVVQNSLGTIRGDIHSFKTK